ncbi:MAG TPA: hypothetical protein PKV66_00250 [Candidatus Pelethenecus sp.]|nr:hypothetical protein [Candidatus Pelethenecus sp.]
MDTLDQNGNVITRGFSTNLSPEQNRTITARSLQPVQALTLQPTPIDTTDYSQYIAPTLTSLAGDFKTLDTQLNTAQRSQADAAQSQLDIMNLLRGKTADTQAAQEQAGVSTETANLNKYAEQLANLNAQASALNREAQAVPLQIQQESQGRGRTEAGVAPIQTARLRENAIRALSIGQQADIAAAAATGSQLRLNAAKEKAQQVVDLKYKPLEEQLAIRKQQYELNKDILSSIDKKRTESLNAAIKREETALAEKKANEKAVSELIVNASSQGAPQETVSRAAKAKTEAEAAQILGVYAGDYLSTQIKKAQLAKLGLENQEAYNKLYGSGAGLRSLSYEDNAKFNSTPEAKAIKDSSNYAAAVANYKAAIEKYGTGEVFGRGSGALNEAYSALVGATKDYYTLGTYDNGVQKLIALGIPEPGVTGIKANRIGALDEALKTAKTKIKANSDQLLSTNYKNTAELKQLLDNANQVLVSSLTNEELLNQIPATQNLTQSTSNFFNR